MSKTKSAMELYEDAKFEKAWEELEAKITPEECPLSTDMIKQKEKITISDAYTSEVLEAFSKTMHGVQYPLPGLEEYDGTGNPCKAAATQVGGSHYQLPIQPITYIMKNELGYCEGNIVKYVSRHREKNGKEDLLKAKQYIDFIIEEEYN